jgi:tetratricopeptide (TPR) repeat protein
VEVGRALEHARLAGDRREEARNLSAYAQSALYGPMPVGEAIERCEALMKEASYDHRASSMILLSLARLYAMAGDVEHARELYAGSRAISQDLGARLHAALASIDAGPIELMAGDLAAAERELRRDYATLKEIGERAYLSTTAAWLAHVLFEAGRLDEAEAQSRVSESLATADDTETQVLWRCALGKVLAARGRFDEAEALVREAVDRTEATDQVDAQGLALTDLGRVLFLAPGRHADAMEAFERAIERFDRKGNVVSSARATALRQQAGAAAQTPLRLEQLHDRDDRPGVVATPTTSRS